MNNLAFKALTFAALIPIWIVLCSAASAGLQRGDRRQSLLLSVPAIVLGFGISFLLGATVTSFAFWTTRVYSFSDLIYMVTLLFSGQFVPAPADAAHHPADRAVSAVPVHALLPGAGHPQRPATRCSSRAAS